MIIKIEKAIEGIMDKIIEAIIVIAIIGFRIEVFWQCAAGVAAIIIVRIFKSKLVILRFGDRTKFEEAKRSLGFN